jgi:ABC-type protease/lipase transport system fused ATPase/permease subunit
LTAPVVAAGLVGGFAAARYSGRRELGGVVLAAAGAWCTTQWYKSKGPVVAGSLLGGYLLAFGASHPLAKKIGAWPSVVAVTAAAAGAAYAVADR